MSTAILNVVNQEKLSVNPLLVQFTNGDVNKNVSEDLRFSLYKSSNSEDVRKKQRKTLVAKTDKMQYVGNNFGLTARSSTLCKYFVGVYNKKSGTMNVYDTKSFKLQPKVTIDEVDGQETNLELSFRQKNDRLVEAFGSTKRKRAMKSRLQNTIDSNELGHSVSTAVTHMLSQPEQGDSSTNTEEYGMLPRFNKEGQNATEIYPLSGVLESKDFDALKSPVIEIISDIKSKLGTWKAEERFCQYVLGHLEILPVNERDGMKKVSCLIYFSYLLQFYQLTYRSLQRQDPLPNIPDAIKTKLFSLFSLQQGKKRCVPKRLKDKLVSYLIVLALIIDGFTIDCILLSKDLKMTPQRFSNYAKAAGCTIESSQGIKKRKLNQDGSSVFKRAILQVPLPKDFPNHMPSLSSWKK